MPIPVQPVAVGCSQQARQNVAILSHHHRANLCQQAATWRQQVLPKNATLPHHHGPNLWQ